MRCENPRARLLRWDAYLISTGDVIDRNPSPEYAARQVQIRNPDSHVIKQLSLGERRDPPSGQTDNVSKPGPLFHGANIRGDYGTLTPPPIPRTSVTVP
jgi:hypothetical protein